MDSTAFLCRGIRNIENTTQYQRAKNFTDEYEVYFFIESDESNMPGDIVDKSEEIYSYPNILPNISLLFSLWAFVTVLYVNNRDTIDAIYTTHQPRYIISGYVLQIVGFTWISEIYDHPLLGIQIAISTGVKIEPNLYNKMNKKLVKKALHSPPDLIVLALHEDVLETSEIFPSTSGVNILKVTNGVDLDLVTAAQSEFAASSKKQRNQFSITYVGPVNKSRNIEHIIDAAKNLSEQNVDFKMNLVGSISNRENLISSIGEHSDHFEIVGEVEHKEALKKIYYSDICLCTLGSIQNHQYAYPIKLFEYMAFGKAVIASEYSGITSVIQHDENGVLVQLETSEQLTDELLRLHNVPELRSSLGEQAKEDVMEYEWHKINKRIIERINDLG